MTTPAKATTTTNRRSFTAAGTHNSTNNNNDNHHHQHDNLDGYQHSSGESSDFFSPISLSFFGKPSQTQQQQQHQQETPQDTSWIGARLSPIGSFDREPVDEDDDEDEDNDQRASIYEKETKQQKALHESLRSARFVTERTRLLETNSHHTSSVTATAMPSYSLSSPHQRRHTTTAFIHPMWNGPQSSRKRNQNRQHDNYNDILWGWRVSFGLILCSLSGSLLLAMGLYDIFEWRIRSETTTTTTMVWWSEYNSNHIAWSFPWLHPTQSALIALGAFVPELIENGSYWRVWTSMFMCTSLVELLILILSWRCIFVAATASRWYRWSGVYFASLITGQLWTMAWDSQTGVVCGCATWGTIAVLCWIGIQCPSRRFALFLFAAVAISLAYLQQHPFGSIYGMVGSTFCGWGLASSEGKLLLLQNNHNDDSMSTVVGKRVDSSPAPPNVVVVWAARGLTVAWTIAPVLVIALR